MVIFFCFRLEAGEGAATVRSLEGVKSVDILSPPKAETKKMLKRHSRPLPGFESMTSGLSASFSNQR